MNLWDFIKNNPVKLTSFIYSILKPLKPGDQTQMKGFCNDVVNKSNQAGLSVATISTYQLKIPFKKYKLHNTTTRLAAETKSKVKAGCLRFIRPRRHQRTWKSAWLLIYSSHYVGHNHRGSSYDQCCGV